MAAQLKIVSMQICKADNFAVVTWESFPILRKVLSQDVCDLFSGDSERK